MNNFKFSSLFLAALVSGCSSLTSGVTQSVSVDTLQIKSAVCELSNDKGKWFVSSTPGTVTVHRSNMDMMVTCEKQGLRGTQAVSSSVKGAMFGNILIGGGIGAAVDHVNGSAYDYPNLIQVHLK